MCSVDEILKGRATVIWVVYSVLAAQAHKHLEEVSFNHDLTEADVTAPVGQLSDPEPLIDTGGRKKGGGRMGGPTLRRWTRFGAE